MIADKPISESEVPTLIEVWAPRCGQCRAMAPDLKAIAAEYAGRVELVEIDASRDGGAVAELGVMATPTLIGIVKGREVYRATGRASRPELGRLFAALEAGAEPLPSVRRSDVFLRAGAGAVLVVTGAVAGPSVPLLLAGAAVISWSVIPILKRGHAVRP